MKITKDMTIQQAIQVDRRLVSVFLTFGMFCIGCPAAASETLEQAAAVHNVDADKLLNALNDFLAQN